MKVLILEDEGLASEKLVNLLKEIDPEIEVAATLKSVEASLEWFASNEAPELIFSDIQLLDGISFEIFQQVKIESPVIFTTAFDQYAIKAFEVNSVDYLLKPVRKEKLEISLNKLKSKAQSGSSSSEKLNKLTELLLQTHKDYKQRFLVKLGHRIQTIPVENISYFFTHDKMTYVVTEDGSKSPMDHTLEEIDQMLDPDQFFRINRKYVVKISAVKEIHPYFKGRVKLKLEPGNNDDDIVISSEKTPSFKRWLDR